MAMGITATTAAIFNAFYDDDRSKMLYHGHSFTANATSCAAALASLDLLLTDSCEAARKLIESHHAAFAATVRAHPMVVDVRQAGTILALELSTDTPSYHSSLRDRLYKFFLSRNIILRPLGNIIYILPPYCITAAELEYVYTCINEFLSGSADTL